MAKLFIGIALVVMLATAGLSYLAHGNIDKLQTSLKDTKVKQATAENQAKAAKNEEEKAKKDAKEAADKAEAAAKVAADKTAEAEKAKMDIAEKQTVIDANTAKIADMQAQLDKMKAGNGIDPAAVDQLKAQLAEATTQKDNAAKEVMEQKALYEAAVAKGEKDKVELADLKKKEDIREKQIGLKGLQGRILAVNSGWNFVVLSVGDKQGVSVNAPLLVVRGNQPIAKLKITSVEPTTSIADVLPGTVPRGVSVQPGDTVIFQGRTAAVTPENPKSSDAPASAPVLPPITTPN